MAVKRNSLEPLAPKKLRNLELFQPRKEYHWLSHDAKQTSISMEVGCCGCYGHVSHGCTLTPPASLMDNAMDPTANQPLEASSPTQVVETHGHWMVVKRKPSCNSMTKSQNSNQSQNRNNCKNHAQNNMSHAKITHSQRPARDSHNSVLDVHHHVALPSQEGSTHLHVPQPYVALHPLDQT
ncbi:hypothetical protein VNO78_22387 [Psophocarpus tetragonolobus]|uniref:Uncharacterized protein n=1 Tax=Psophocarpus tetragonolobus TaxID=3891 RepID=A0AAN9SCH8_PSOTE